MSGSTASKTLSPARIASLVLPPLAVMAFIFFLSAQQSGGDHGTFELLLRKLAHVTEYAVLTLAWWRALRGLGARRDVKSTLALAIAIALAYSATDEFHQTFVRGRHGTPVDVLIDAIGMGIAWLVVSRAYARRRSLGPSRPSAA
jgi:VanZ family protein